MLDYSYLKGLQVDYICMCSCIYRCTYDTWYLKCVSQLKNMYTHWYLVTLTYTTSNFCQSEEGIPPPSLLCLVFHNKALQRDLQKLNN